MKVLVTGASGTLGRSVCKLLRSLDHKVVAYSRDPSRLIEHCKGCTHVVGDIQDFYSLKHAIGSDVDAIVHAAAIKHVDVCEEDPSLALSSIVGGTENVLKAIESKGDQIKVAALISSDKACHAGSQIYGLCKYFTERLVKQYSTRVSARVNSMRFGNLFGSSGSVLPIWVKAIEKGQDISLRRFAEGDGNALRFAMLPSTAARYVVDTLTTGNLASGTVICPTGVGVLNMGVVAEVLLKVTKAKSRLMVCPSYPGEQSFERIFTMEEGRNLRSFKLDQSNVYEIGDCHRSYIQFDWEMVTRYEDAMDESKTTEFVKSAIVEMKEWM